MTDFKPISPEELANSVLYAIEAANTDFEIATRGSWLSDAGAQGILQARIYDELKRLTLLRNLGMGVELSIKQICGVRSAENFPGSFTGRRPDISIWDEDGSYLILGEIKRTWPGKGVMEDIERCLEFIEYLPETKFCFFACMLLYNPRERTKFVNIDGVKGQFQEAVKNKFEKLLN